MITLQFYDSHFQNVESTEDKNGNETNIIQSNNFEKIKAYIFSKAKKIKRDNKNLEQDLIEFFERNDQYWTDQFQGWSHDFHFQLWILDDEENIN